VAGAKQVIGAWSEAFNAHDEERMRALCAEDMILEAPGDVRVEGRDDGPGAMREWLLSNSASFPDYREEIEWLVGEGDYVAWRSRGTGTHRGPMGPFPPTNRRMDLAIIGMHRFEDGKIVETWTSWDNVAVLMQLGLMPPAGSEPGEEME